ncbi:MAG: TetR/AcrR family transcriptional regulator C-terminal domain-containing protein [Lachnospiraceae bacterium]
MKYETTSLNTKKTLAESLKKIMRQKSFSKITVSEIIADCGLNRKTFYYHFTDIYDLLKWIFENEAIEVIQHFNLAVDYEDAILFVMDYVEKNDYIINCAYDSIGRDEMKRFFYSDFIELVSTIINTAETEFETHLDAGYKIFLCNFYTEALAGMLIDWIKNRETRNRALVIEYISKTLKESLTGIMQKNIGSGQ